MTYNSVPVDCCAESREPLGQIIGETRDAQMEVVQEIGAITQWEAFKEIGCSRLAARVKDLKKAGYPITKIMETTRNRYGKKVSFAKYSLKKEVEQ